MEPFNQIQTSQTLEEEQNNTQGQTPNGWLRTQLNDTDNHLTPQSLDSILYQIEKMG
jgi:hypothetical protein